MKRVVAIIIVIIMVLLFVFPYALMGVNAMTLMDIKSDIAVLMDADTGQILYDKNMDQKAYPASMTKIMTGIVALEECYPAEILTVNESAIDIDEPASSNIALTTGEELTLDEAMYAIMLPSANDAANVIAEHVAGSQEAFAAMMTEKAKLIGAVHTNFSNAHGLHEANHYTTAYDMALITKYAAGDRLFMRYFGADLHTMAATNKQVQERPFTNYQYMLVESTQHYNPDVIGGKVGYTTPAKHTMSTIATRDGRTLICIVMGSPDRNQKFYDTQALLDYGFDEFYSVTIPQSELAEKQVSIRESASKPELGYAVFNATNDFTFLLHNSVEKSSVRFDLSLADFIKPGDKAEGYVNLVADSNEEAVPSLLLTAPLSAKVTFTTPNISFSPEPEDESKSAPLFLVAVIPIALITSAFLYRQYGIYKRRKARLRRLNKRMKIENVYAANRSSGYTSSDNTTSSGRWTGI